MIAADKHSRTDRYTRRDTRIRTGRRCPAAVRAVAAWMIVILAAAGLFPFGASSAAYAVSPSDIQTGDHVYMGRAGIPGYSGLPCWRVLDREADGSFLFMSEYLWKGDGDDDETLIQFNPQAFHYEWQESYARVWCQDFEKAVLQGIPGLTILKTTRSDPEYASRDFDNVIYQARDEILKDDTVFFLSAEEVAEQYMTTTAQRIAYLHDGTYKGDSESWWLRSPRWLSELASVTCVGRVFSFGDVGKNEVYQYSAARPAFRGRLAEGTPISKCTHDEAAAWVVGTGSATPHYTAPRYRWSADNSTCTADATCTTCGTTVSETVKTSSAVTRQATASEYGITTYTAPFAKAPFKAQTKQLVTPKKEASPSSGSDPAPAAVKTRLPNLSITGLIKAKKAFTVKWKKLSAKDQKKVTGIQVQYARNRNFTKGKVTRTVKKTKASVKIRKLKSKKTYWVRIRTYKKAGGKKQTGKWSKIKKVKVK